MRNNLFFMGFVFVFFTCAMFADEVFISKPVKKQSNSVLKEKIMHQAKQLMRECNNLIREISVQHDVIITQFEDMAESQNFFAQADNKELASCAHHLEELSARLEKTRLELQQDMKLAFKSRKK